jgi:phage-related protein
MSKAIDTAIGLIKELGAIGGNVFSILGSIMGAAQQTGGGFLGVLKDITGALAGAFKSPAVQGALHALFDTMAAIGRTAAPLVVQALKVIAPVLTALGPPAQRLVQALGKALGPIIAALGPVLLAAAVAVGQLSDAVAPLLPVVGQMIASLGPVLTPILTLVGDLFAALAPPLVQLGRVLLPPLVKLTGTLVDVFHRAAPVLDKALSQLGMGLVPVIDGLGKVVGQFVTQYADEFLAAFMQLLPIIPQLVPMFLQFATSAGQILTAIAPLLPQLMLLSTQFLLNLLPALIPLIPPLTQLTIALTILATGVITRVVIPALTLLVKFMQGLRRAFQPAIDAVTWLTTTIAHTFEWLADHLVGHSVIPDMINSIVRWFGGLPGRAWSALANLAGNIAGRARDAGEAMVRAIRQGLDNAVGWLGGLGGRALRAIGDLGGVLWNSGQALLKGFIGGIKSMGGLVDNAVSSVLSGAKSFFPNSPAKKGPFSGSGWTHHSGRATARDYAGGLLAEADTVGAAAAALMGSASDGIGGPGLAVQGRGMAGYSAGGGAAAGGRVDLRITVDGPEAVKKLIRTIVRTDGRGGANSVQTVFGG